MSGYPKLAIALSIVALIVLVTLVATCGHRSREDALPKHLSYTEPY